MRIARQPVTSSSDRYRWKFTKFADGFCIKVGAILICEGQQEYAFTDRETIGKVNYEHNQIYKDSVS